MSCWSCTVDTCSNQALLLNGDCEACGDHYCGTHLIDKAAHLCLGIDDQKDIIKKSTDLYDRVRQEAIAEIDLKEIRAEARRLRPGHTCRTPKKKLLGTITKSTFGNLRNILFVLTFDDGLKWVVRLRIKKSRDPAPVAVNLGMRSEAATVQSLYDGQVKVPKVYLPSNGMAYRPGKQDYFFMEFVLGVEHPLFLGHHDFCNIVEQQARQVFLRIAAWYISLEKVTYDRCGSPTYDTDGNVTIGPVIMNFPLHGSEPYFLGPYDTPWQRQIAYFDRMMELVLAGNFCTPAKTIGVYLQLLEARTLVEECAELRDDHGPFYMLHGDPKSDVFMFTEDGEISGVLDWEHSWTTTKAMAFASPFFPNDSAHDNHLRPFDIALGDAYLHLGRPDLAGFVESGRKYQWLTSIIWGLTPNVSDLNLLRQAFGQPSLKADETWPADMKEWKQVAGEAYAKDPGLKILQKEKRARVRLCKQKRETFVQL